MKTIHFDDNESAVSIAAKIVQTSPGYFGRIYDAEEIVTLLDSWTDDDPENPDGMYFDPEDAEDREAILAWCEQAEHSGLCEAMFQVLADNLPTRSEAYDLLAVKRACVEENELAGQRAARFREDKIIADMRQNRGDFD